MTDEGPFTLVAALDEGVAHVTIQGELDLDRADEVAGQLGDLATQGATEVRIDTSELTFIDSSGLRALLTAREHLEQAGATMQLTTLSAAVARLLDMTGTRTILTGH